jgi:tripartite-type tricarboxylate transporter receptor subunit TctC
MWKKIAAVLGMACSLTAAMAYPTKPIKLLVPYMAGSPADALARLVADGMARDLNNPVIVENRPGASGMIGMSVVSKSAPDGYTLALASMDTQAINPWIYKKIPYQALHDFAPVAMLGSFNMFLVSGKSSTVKSGRDVIEQARKSPDKVSYGTWGVGSLAHLWGMSLEKAAGVKLFHVPFQGSPAAMQSMLSGQVDMIFMLPNVAENMVKDGKVQILGSTSADRLPQYPQVPTLAEQGFTGFSGVEWFAVYAPANTPASVIDVLNASANRVLASPQVIQRIEGLSMKAEGGTPQSLRATEIKDSQMWKELIQKSNFEQLD